MKPLDPRLLRHARATAVHLGVSVVLGLATAGLVIVQAGLLATAITETFLHGAALAGLRSTVLALAGVIVVRAGVSWLQEAVSYRASTAVKSQLRGQLLAHAARLGPRWLAGERTGEIATLATRGIDALDDYFAKYLPQLVLSVIVPAAVLARIFPLDRVATITIALTLPLIPVFMALVGLATEARSRRRWRALSLLGHHFLDVIVGLPTLKVFGRAKAQAENVRRVTDDYRRETMATLRLAFVSSLVLELVATLSVALVAVGIGLRLIDDSLDLYTALLVLILAPAAYLPLRQVGAHYHASAEGLAAAERVFAVLETPLPLYGGAAAVPDLRSGEVRVEDLAVLHPGREQPAPAGVSLTLRRGEVVAVAGPSGAGKSTLIHVLLGLLPYDAGRIVVADARSSRELSELDLESWRRQLAWVPQQPYLFAGSVAENVRLGAPEATDSEVLHALEAAGLAGVDPATRLGERGVGLSAGQRRRVAIARALLRKAGVLLLDEPTAGLDSDTEVEVLGTIRRAARDSAVLLVAHRPAALQIADRVVMLPPVATEALA